MQGVRNIFGAGTSDFWIIFFFLPSLQQYIYSCPKEKHESKFLLAEKKRVKSNFKLMEIFLLLHAFSPVTATIITFSNHYTEANTFQNSTVTKGRAKDSQKETKGYEETVR